VKLMNIVADKGTGGVAKGERSSVPDPDHDLFEDPSEEYVGQNHELLSGVSAFYNNAELSDVVLCVGEERYKSHRIVLSCMSQVFQRMLHNASNWNECKTTEIPLTEIPQCADKFGLFLQYIYTNRVPLQDDNVKPLFLLADKYAVFSLRELCADYFQRHLSANNVLDVLSFAHNCQDAAESLFNRCLQFVAENAEEVMYTPGWQDLDQSILILIVQRDDLQIWNEIELFSAVLRWVNAVPKREQLVPQIFHLLRFPLICYELLTHLVEPNLIFQRCPEIQYLLTEAYKYQLLPDDQRRKYFKDNIRVRPRQYNFKELGRFAYCVKSYSEIKKCRRIVTESFKTDACLGGIPVPPPPVRPDGTQPEALKWNWMLWVEPKGDADTDDPSLTEDDNLPFGLYLMPVKSEKHFSEQTEQRDIDCVFVAFGRDADGQPTGHSLRDSYSYEGQSVMGYGEPDLLKDENYSQSYIHNDEIDILVLIGYRPQAQSEIKSSNTHIKTETM